MVAGPGAGACAKVCSVKPLLSAAANARASLSPDLTLRIERAFGPEADLMLRIQAAYDAARFPSVKGR